MWQGSSGVCISLPLLCRLPSSATNPRSNSSEKREFSYRHRCFRLVLTWLIHSSFCFISVFTRSCHRSSFPDRESVINRIFIMSLQFAEKTPDFKTPIGQDLENLAIAFIVIQTIVMCLYYTSRWIHTKEISGVEMTFFMPLGYISTVGNSIVTIRKHAHNPIPSICRRQIERSRRMGLSSSDNQPCDRH